MLLRWLTEFGPVATFVVVYRFSDFFTATATLMGVTLLAFAGAWLREGRLALFPLLYASNVLLFGAATLLLGKPAVLMLQDTLASAAFSVLLLGSLLAGEPLLERLFDPLFALTRAGWSILSVRWGAYFMAYAVANELIRNLMSEPGWVAFKGCAILITVAFGCYQFSVARRERLPDESNAWGVRLSPPASASLEAGVGCVPRAEPTD